MKISAEKITREHIWKVADVRGIPLGWRREVYYSLTNEELYALLLSPGTIYVAPQGDVFLDSFTSIWEFWRNFPYSAEEAGVEDERDIEETYYAVWFDEFKYPKEL